MKKHNKIKSFQGLRLIAFSLIFLSHSGIKIFTPFVAGGASGVMVFFVLSGFLESYNHIEKRKDEFNRSRIEALWVLGLVTSLLSFIVWIMMGHQVDIKALLSLGASIMCLQSWLPSIYYHFMFSTVTWFISALFFCYLLTPFFLNKLRKYKHSKKVLLVLLIICKAVFEIIITFYCTDVMKHYFTYIFPIYRCLDYLCGMILGGIFLEEKKDDRIGSFLELLVILFFLLFSWISSNIIDYKYGSMLLISVLFLLYVFSFEKGFISNFFKIRLIQFLGGRTKYYFVFHIVILQFTNYAMKNLIFGTVIALFITFTITEIYIFISDFFSKR